jgi:hypothetical protein
VVGIDSVGFSAYYKELFVDLGMVMTSITATFLQQHDKRRKVVVVYTKKAAGRRLQAQRKLENMNREWKREVIKKQKGNTYQS